MTTAVLDQPPRALVGDALTYAADQLTVFGGRAGALLSDRVDGVRRREADIVWIVLIVAVAVVIAVGVLAWVAIYCIGRGGSYSGGLSFHTNGWKVWEYSMKFSCTQ